MFGGGFDILDLRGIIVVEILQQIIEKLVFFGIESAHFGNIVVRGKRAQPGDFNLHAMRDERGFGKIGRERRALSLIAAIKRRKHRKRHRK